jgi:GTP-binding protein LepA
MNIRNFCIIAHVDHGKSTLADSLLRTTGTISERELLPQHLDTMELERERGITIKLQPVRMQYRGHELNLIDTPGHVDFAYEVSRSLAAVEGALLLVDASQGIQAQTLANLHVAKAAGLAIIPVATKADLPSADVVGTVASLAELVGVSEDQVIVTSAKARQGITEVLDAIVDRIPAPSGSAAAPLQALVFDSKYDEYRGVVAYLRVMNGAVRKGDRVLMVAAGEVNEVLEVGYFTPNMVASPSLAAGEVGYAVLGTKQLSAVRVGDTVTTAVAPAPPLLGYQPMPPMVFAGLYTKDGSQFEQLRTALGKLQLTDASLEAVPERSSVLGQGFRCGFLGLLHMEIIKERLLREYGLIVLLTAPSVAYHVERPGTAMQIVSSPTDWPEASHQWTALEPYVDVEIITPAAYQGAMIQLVVSRRGTYHTVASLPGDRLRLTFDMPLAEILTDFYDQLKSISSGYASLSYAVTNYRPTDVVRLDILLAEERVDGLSRLIFRDQAPRLGREMVASLKELLPRQQFELKIQAAVGGKVIAAERISAMRKDVTAGLYGGDVTRKRKVLEKQKAGKRRMASHGSVDVPAEVYWTVFKPRSSSSRN